MPGKKSRAVKKAAPRADFGAPIGGYIAKQPAHLREILEALRKLIGKGKGGRHLKLRSLDELPKASVRGWLRTSAKYARDKGK